MQYIYPLLVAGPTDVPGALAYFVYKRTKIEWRERFAQDHGRQPLPQEEAAFVQYMALPESTASLKQRGEELASEFANELLEEKMAALAAEVVQSELSSKFVSLEGQVVSSLSRIESRFDEKKGFGGWMRDIGTSLISSLGAIVLVGAIALGYTWLSKANTTTERAVGIGADQGTAPATQPSSANNAVNR